MVAVVESGFEERRRLMVERQLEARGIKSRKVLEAFLDVPRELFVPEESEDEAYDDKPLPTRLGQTISQPYMSACMTELLELPEGASCKTLEVGAGTGYQSAIFARMGHRAIAVELLEELADYARERISLTPWASQVKIVTGDGSLGWPEEAPFDAILVSAAAPGIPPPLAGQLKTGGKLVIPVGNLSMQRLMQATKLPDGSLELRAGIGCRFVPLRGRYGFKQ